MRGLLLGAFLLSGGAAFAANPAPVFTSSRVAPSGLLLLKAATGYFHLKDADKKSAVERAAAAAPSVSVVAVEAAGEGELWSVAAGTAAALDSWSERGMRFEPRSRRAGRWFGYLGGQFARGGDFPSNGWTGRLGTTLFKDRYDAAISLSQNSLSGISDSEVTNIGLTLRALYPYTAHTGLNLGGQLDRGSASGGSSLTLAAVCGINIYLPGGSFDVSLSLGEEGRASLLAGYTVFISR